MLMNLRLHEEKRRLTIMAVLIAVGKVESMKTCPVCKARCFDDMEVCFGCLHHFDANDEAGQHGPRSQVTQVLGEIFGDENEPDAPKERLSGERHEAAADASTATSMMPAASGAGSASDFDRLEQEIPLVVARRKVDSAKDDKGESPIPKAENVKAENVGKRFHAAEGCQMAVDGTAGRTIADMVMKGEYRLVISLEQIGKIEKEPTTVS